MIYPHMMESKNLTPNIHASSSNPEVVRTMVANGYGYTITNVRPKNLAALDGRKLKSIALAGEHKSMKIGIMTLLQDHKPRILTAFEEHCRGMITKDHIPGMLPLAE